MGTKYDWWKSFWITLQQYSFWACTNRTNLHSQVVLGIPCLLIMRLQLQVGHPLTQSLQSFWFYPLACAAPQLLSCLPSLNDVFLFVLFFFLMDMPDVGSSQALSLYSLVKQFFVAVCNLALENKILPLALVDTFVCLPFTLYNLGEPPEVFTWTGLDDELSWPEESHR